MASRYDPRVGSRHVQTPLDFSQPLNREIGNRKPRSSGSHALPGTLDSSGANLAPRLTQGTYHTGSFFYFYFIVIIVFVSWCSSLEELSLKLKLFRAPKSFPILNSSKFGP